MITNLKNRIFNKARKLYNNDDKKAFQLYQATWQTTFEESDNLWQDNLDSFLGYYATIG